MNVVEYSQLYNLDESLIREMFAIGISTVAGSDLRDAIVKEINLRFLSDALCNPSVLIPDLLRSLDSALKGDLNNLDELYVRSMLEALRHYREIDDDEDLVWLIKYADSISYAITLKVIELAKEINSPSFKLSNITCETKRAWVMRFS